MTKQQAYAMIWEIKKKVLFKSRHKIRVNLALLQVIPESFIEFCSAVHMA